MTVFQIPASKVRLRADFFLDEAERICSGSPFTDHGFRLTEEAALSTAEAYFLVNEAYKARRQNQGHRTQPTKVAALTAAVIATVNPLRPEQALSEPNLVSTYANPLFALRLGCNIIQHPLHRSPWNRLQWFCDNLRDDPLTCLDGYLELVRSGKRVIGSDFDIDLSPNELKRLEGRVGFFDVLSEMKVYRDN
ncbi:hypothetical protein [Mesorhizobium sp.]|uniref:hypothetical protein n=1 Tax=Mesorhizobium sp. TaxID=1871066 RepID=UPI000FE2FDCF|nr:hypothetical protein [Mesorhizobium sp.]RWQ16068.1 MAG: hypothetical protein EOR92_22575 [Mesorhizobium sp.]